MHTAYISEKVMDLKNRVEQITLEEYKELRMNSYEREYLIDKYDTETLDYLLDLYLDNCAVEKPQYHRPAPHYDSAVVWHLLPELRRRLKEQEATIVKGPRICTFPVSRELEISFERADPNGALYESEVALISHGSFKLESDRVTATFVVLNISELFGPFNAGQAYDLEITPSYLKFLKTGDMYKILHCCDVSETVRTVQVRDNR